MDAAPSDAERSAVDGLLGPPGERLGGWAVSERRNETSASCEAAARRATSATSCSRRCTRSRRASGGSAVGVSTTSPSGCRCRRPMPTASRRSTRCSASRSDPANVVHVCDDLACRGAAASPSARSWSATPGRRAADAGGWTWVRSPCLGMCEQAPAVFAQRAGRPEVALGERDPSDRGCDRRARLRRSCAPGGSAHPRRADRAGRRGSAAPPPRRRRRSRVDRRLPGARWLRGAPRGPRDGTGGRDRRGDRREAPRDAAAPRSPPG